ncbi:TonB-dependent receptor [Pelomonas cellulosilytica]|uniref:TonB-dependent receptor n=1 Tax=Pelomonas cellulosilytica TaxID=2906762 RepID=A0ABS8Y0V2_9BURK|nr:TonB-dependent receptor [Pelomonas sp. P8]MCE4556649.1 TonB-dependent receptor [Pelomonas sp. P8]
MRHFKQTTLSLAAAQALLVWAGPAAAQTAPAAADGKGTQQLETVVVSGQRAALQSAQRIKQNSDEIVDSIVADDIGKLPDRSVSEVLQRIVGVTMDRVMARGDPAHFSVEGSGVIIRGLTYVSSQLNGRESFSANGGRGLSFEDVPPELMAGVDVYKNPSAEQIEGAIGGLVNLRTALPFDYGGFKASFGVQMTNAKLGDKTKPSASALLSNTWNTPLGKVGLLVDVAYSESATRTDGIYVDPYFQTVEKWADKTDGDNNTYYRPLPGNHWFPKAVGWRTLEFDRKRQGTYIAGQWKKDEFAATATYFRSKYRFYWDESSIDSQADPYNAVVSSDAKWGSNGALLTGTITDPVHGGIPFNADTRFATRNSLTQESTFNFVWTPTPALRISNDFQFIESTTSSFDSTVATGINMPKESVDFTGSMPRLNLDAADMAYLADPSKYYWAFTMEHLDRSRATQKAWKGDVRYTFDHPVLHDLRVGLRLTDRDVKNVVSNPSYNWKAVTQTWQSAEFDAGAKDQSWDWHPIRSLAYLSRFGGDTQVKQFNNFMNGRGSVASLVLPKMSVAANYPSSYATLHSYYDTLCTEYKRQLQGASADPCPVSWSPAAFGDDSPNSNKQHEKTQTAYAQLRFGFDEYNVPVDGNAGLRVVETKYSTNGYQSLTFNPTTAATDPNLVGTIPSFAPYLKPVVADTSYTDVLPSLNLRWKLNDKMQVRFAFAKAVARPDFSDLQPNIQLTAGTATTRTVVDTTVTPNKRQIFIDDLRNVGTALGNPTLKPVKSDQFDVTGEWYLDKTSSITMAVFNKQLKDVIVNQIGVVSAVDTTGKSYDFAYSTKVNGAKGWARGVELAVQHYFNGLPGLLSGLGVQANFTYVDSKQSRYNSVDSAWCSSNADGTNLNLFVNGCDTNAQSYGGLPLPNLSRKAYNLAILYDHGPLSARLAYAWRGKYLNGVAFPDNTGPNQTNGLNGNPNSPQYGRNNMPLGLPLWTADYGQLDLGVFYKVTEQLQLGFEGQNLTDSVYKQLMQQHIGLMGRTWFASGPRYTVTARYTF